MFEPNTTVRVFIGTVFHMDPRASIYTGVVFNRVGCYHADENRRIVNSVCMECMCD